MEGESSSGNNIIPESFQFQDMQSSIQLHHSQNHQFYGYDSIVYSEIKDALPSSVPNIPMADNYGTLSHHEGQKSMPTDGIDMNLTESIDRHAEVEKGMGRCLWQRMKWTDQMVKLLINALSYIGEEASSQHVGALKRKPSLLQKIGKWKCVSRVMAVRGYHVSPQQCEDKFNDLNKRYKRLNEILGRGISCEVVENPMILNVMDIPEKTKEDVRKILSSKHLYYEEMCSYHNRNRLHLPPDPALQHFLQALWGTHDPGTDYSFQNLGAGAADDRIEDSKRRSKQIDETEDPVVVGNPGKASFCNSTLGAHPQNRIELGFSSQDSKTHMQQRYQIAVQALQLEDKKLKMKAQMLELKKQRLQMEMMRWKQDTEMEKMRLENERIKLENQHMTLELQRKKMSGNYN